MLVLAKCINGAHSDNQLALGEYYALDMDLLPCPFPGHYVVISRAIPDELLVEDNFYKPLGVGAFAFSDESLIRKLSVYATPLNRFEVLYRIEQLKAACHKAAERTSYVTGAYKGKKP